MKITITKTTAPKTKPDSAKLGFGKHFTDHMFIMDYVRGQGWINPRIEPFAPFLIEMNLLKRCFISYRKSILPIRKNILS